MKKNINTKEYWDKFYKQARFKGKHKWKIATYKYIAEVFNRRDYYCKKNPTVLDIGCAFGDGINYLSKQKIFEGGKFSGIDFSDECIEWAKQKYPKIEFGVVDINNIVTNSNIFNVIIASEILEHLDNDYEILQILRDICDILIVTVPYKEDENNLITEHIRSYDELSFIQAKTTIVDNTLIAIYKK